MQIINFLNPISRSRWYNPKIKHYALLSLCFLTAITMITILFINQFATYIAKVQEKNCLQAQFDAAKPMIQKFSSLQTNYTKIQETIAQLQQKNQALSSILMHMSKIIPNGVRIAECTFDKSDVTIIGYAKKLSKLYAFLQALAHHPSAEKVTLLKTIQETDNQQNLIKFFCTIFPAKNK